MVNNVHAALDVIGRLLSIAIKSCIACPQIMGAHLSSLRGLEDEEEAWCEALKMLMEAEDPPDRRLFASLSISYNGLKADQRRMFLDAAFFFLGRRADTAKHAWRGYG